MVSLSAITITIPLRIHAIVATAAGIAVVVPGENDHYYGGWYNNGRSSWVFSLWYR